MRNKKEQIPVQRLYMDRNQNRYKNIIWITFLALLLTGGTFLVIRESWKGQLSALPVCILTAGAGILCCVLAEIMRERIRFVTAIAGLPWIVLYRSFSWRLDRRTGMDQYADQPVEYCECGRSGIIFCAGVHA